MATYAIGDLQGCCTELLDLLDSINYDERRDRVWFTGDLVNRGPESLQALRFARHLDGAITVLGNHDLHLLAVAGGHARMRKKDTLGDILKAEDRDDLLDWLRGQRLLYRDEELGYVMVHAGLVPQWTTDQAQALAAELEQVLRGSDAPAFFEHMYGDGPTCWSDALSGWDRLRFITNCFTRMRFCDARGCLALKEKGPPDRRGASAFSPWYEVPGRRSAGERIIFGHWSTIHLSEDNNFPAHRVFPLDTGCIWGGSLTALRLDDGRLFTVPSRQPKYHADD